MSERGREMSDGSTTRRHCVALIWLAAALPAGTSGCTLLPWLADPWFSYTSECLDRYQDYYDRMDAAFEALPSVEVEIINEGDCAIRAQFLLAVEVADVPPGSRPRCLVGPDTIYGDGFDRLDVAEVRSVGVAPGSSVEGTIACSDGIAIQVLDDCAGTFREYASDPGVWDSPGYSRGGNVVLRGMGVESSLSSGDVVDQARVVLPAIDGLDCETGRLVLRIINTGVYDEGDIGVGGTGTVSIE